MKTGTIICSNCGTIHEVTILEAPSQDVTLVQHTTQETTWLKIKEEIVKGNAASVLSVGDKIRTVLKNGQTVYFVVAAINPYDTNEVAFVLENCLDNVNLPMNNNGYNKGGWSKCDLRTKLNGEIINLLPDELVAIIKPRKIVQQFKSETLTSVDKLWLLSRTEVFGNAYDTDVNDVHFPLFDTARSRVKNNKGEIEWWWLRSPNASGSTNFCSVHNGGYSNGSNASGSNGVAFGFLL